MATWWGPVASNGYTIYGDICKVQVRSLGIFELKGRSDNHGKVGLGILLTAYGLSSR